MISSAPKIPAPQQFSGYRGLVPFVMLLLPLVPLMLLSRLLLLLLLLLLLQPLLLLHSNLLPLWGGGPPIS